MSIEDPRPSAPSAGILAEDLSLSNEEALSWFTYRPGATPDTIEADLLTELGEVETTFTIQLVITPDPAAPNQVEGDATARADAWDEGWTARAQYDHTPDVDEPVAENPYRAAATAETTAEGKVEDTVLDAAAELMALHAYRGDACTECGHDGNPQSHHVDLLARAGLLVTTLPRGAR